MGESNGVFGLYPANYTQEVGQKESHDHKRMDQLLQREELQLETAAVSQKHGSVPMMHTTS